MAGDDLDQMLAKLRADWLKAKASSQPEWRKGQRLAHIEMQANALKALAGLGPVLISERGEW